METDADNYHGIARGSCEQVPESYKLTSLSPLVKVVGNMIPLQRLAINRHDPARHLSVIPFTITSRHIQLMSRKQLGENIQAHLRIALLSTKKAQSDMLPPQASIRVNGVKIKLLEDPNCPHRILRAGGSYNITKQIIWDTSRKNYLEVKWGKGHSGHDKDYVVCVVIVKSIHARVCFDKIRDEQTLSYYVTKTNIITHWEEYANDGLVDSIDNLEKFSLICPIRKCRIRYPGRGNLCLHISCFDIWNFIRINQGRSSWRCPLCDVSCKPKELRMDLYLMRVIKALIAFGTDTTDITLLRDGSWRPIHPTCNLSASQGQDAEFITVDDDDVEIVKVVQVIR